jgi:hypothetical protein
VNVRGVRPLGGAINDGHGAPLGQLSPNLLHGHSA